MKATVTTPTAPQVSAADVARSLGRCAALCLVYVLQTIAKALDLHSVQPWACASGSTVATTSPTRRTP